MKGSQADSEVAGYRETSRPDGGVTVRFRGALSLRAQVEEIALLRAVELARQAGKRGFIITDRWDTSWSTELLYYRTPFRSDPDGFETELDFQFVDPPAGDVEAWLGLRADSVCNALVPAYASPHT
jgi:hypothetical protein